MKRRTGGKTIGRGWKGRRCWAAIRVARRVGGKDEPRYGVSD